MAARTPEPSPPPRPESEAEMGFERQPMVGWLRPRFLAGAGLEVFVAGLFARFLDKRELLGGLPGYGADLAEDAPPRGASDAPPPYTDGAYRDEDGSLWLDYAADVGEGFKATYTVAWLLAKASLAFGDGAEARKTKRGRLLILGGDQVYPGASWDGYRDRFAGPFRSALPHLPSEEVPHMFAIPGNHDWYDGLTSFTRLFTQGSWIGAWRTRQRRSYFALRLSERWWLWATDVQLDTYIDGPQLEYFRAAATDLEEGHRVILATAKPSWLAAKSKGPTAKKEGSWETLRFVEERLIGASDGELAVAVSGDRHHYAHYTRESGDGPEHRITAGGGGAHTMGTHGLPQSIKLESLDPGKPAARYKLGTTSPTPEESKALRDNGFLSAVMRTEGLGVLIGTLYALIALAIASAVKDQATGITSGPEGFSVPGIVFDAGSQWSIGLIALLGLALWSFADVNDKQVRFRVVLRHWLEHLVIAVLPPFLLIMLLDETGLAKEGLLVGWIAAASAFFLGFFGGRFVFARYILRVNRAGPRRHAGEIFGALGSTDYKNFLRMKIDADERLTIYPVGIARSVEWEFQPEGGGDDPWFVPAGDDPDPRLLEAPIVVKADGPPAP